MTEDQGRSSTTATPPQHHSDTEASSTPAAEQSGVGSTTNRAATETLTRGKVQHDRIGGEGEELRGGVRERSSAPSHDEAAQRRRSTTERRRHRNPNPRVGLRTNTPGGEKQIEGEAKVERREGSRLRPSTTTELAGARRNRPATAKAKRGSRRPRE